MTSPLSLTARLTLLFASGSSIILLSLGWLIGSSIERHFEEQDHDALSGKLMLAHHIIERVGSASELALLPDQLNDAIVGHHDLVVQVLGPQGQVLLASPNINFPQPLKVVAGTAPTTATATHSANKLFVWHQGGRSYRGIAATFHTGVAAWPALPVLVALDIGHHQAFMSNLMRTLWLFVAGAALLTGVLGWFAARRSLAPLRAMRERAAAVTAQKLDQRLAVDSVPPELAELATTLNEMLARLEEAFQRLSDFSSDLAHELRTPISNLMTQTQVSLSRPRDAASYRDILESNAEEFERLARMISDMLFLAKAENGLTLANREQVNLAQEVRKLFEFYEALAEEKNIRLQLTGEGTATGDRLMLRRAISNLLSNALRHTPQDGYVLVAITPNNAGELTLTIENPGDTIPPQHLARLFERFYRADPSRQHSSGEGTGLGLAITLAIVSAHQGKLSATSANNLSRFMIALPR
ncbi:sensor histidine kinase [soil metagenome]